MCLSVAIRILLNNKSTSESYGYAEKLLKCFVKDVSEHYGDEQLVYNVHSLIHLADDARKYGSLNTISCFLFERFLGHLKSVVCRPQNPISQIVRRYAKKVRANGNLVAEHNSPDAALKCHSQKHNAGPLPSSHSKFDQYKRYLGKYFASITSPNNCFDVNGSIYIL